MQDASDKLSSYARRGLLFLNYATIYTCIARELCHLPEGILSHHHVEIFLLSSTAFIEVNIFSIYFLLKLLVRIIFRHECAFGVVCSSVLLFKVACT